MTKRLFSQQNEEAGKSLAMQPRLSLMAKLAQSNQSGNREKVFKVSHVQHILTVTSADVSSTKHSVTQGMRKAFGGFF